MKIKFPVDIRSSLGSVTITVPWIVTPCTELHVVTAQKNIISNILAIHLMSVTQCEYHFLGTQMKEEQKAS